MNPADSKPWYASKTIWATIVSALSFAALMLHRPVSSGLQGDVIDWLTALGTLAGQGFAIYGRAKAEQKIGGGGSGAAPLLLLPLLMLPLLMLPFLGSGCTQHVDANGQALSKTDSALISTEDGYTFAVNEIDAALRAGLLNRAQLQPWLPIRNAARAALDRAEVHQKAGDPTSLSADLDEAQAALARLQPLLTWLKPTNPAPPTK